MGKDKDEVIKLIEKFINLSRIEELIKGIEMMIEIVLINKRISYGHNSYLNEVKKMLKVRIILYEKWIKK